VLAFLENHPAEDMSPESSAKPAWHELTVEPFPPDASVLDVIGEHLRVFINSCTWAWAQKAGISYTEAKARWTLAGGASTSHDSRALPEVDELCNARTFMAYLVSAGVVNASSRVPVASASRAFERTDVERAIQHYVESCTLSR